jgi:hypothetical protein
VEQRGCFPAASVDPTEARNAPAGRRSSFPTSLIVASGNRDRILSHREVPHPVRATSEIPPGQSMIPRRTPCRDTESLEIAGRDPRTLTCAARGGPPRWGGTASTARPAEDREALKQELERICLKALSIRSSERYTTVKDMAEDLRAYLRAGGVEIVGQCEMKGSGHWGRGSVITARQGRDGPRPRRRNSPLSNREDGVRIPPMTTVRNVARSDPTACYGWRVALTRLIPTGHFLLA